MGVPAGAHITVDILDRLRELGLNIIGYRDGLDPVKGRRVRIAVLAASDRTSALFS